MSRDRDESLHDEALSRLYRQGAHAEPPPALDALILAAARREAATPASRPVEKRPTPWWRNWLAPVGVLATIVLTVSLTLNVEREQRDALPAAAPAPAAAPVLPEAAVESAKSLSIPAAKPAAPIELKTKARKENLQREAPLAEPEPTPVTAPAAAAPAPSAPLPFPQAAVPHAAPSVAADRPPEEMRATARAASRPAAAAGAGTGMSSTESTDQSAAQGFMAPAPAAAKRARVLPERVVKSPDTWIEEIRRLKNSGQSTQAREQLAAFRQAYPDFRLPDDLQRE